MQIKRVTDNDVICQQRLLSSNIEWILNKRNKKNIKWCFKLYSVFYKAWGFFELFRSSFEELSSSLLLEYCVSKSWWESWLLSQDSIFWIWAGLLACDFVQSLPKWPGSPHLQHLSEHVETAAWWSSQWGESCWMGSDNLVTQRLIAGEVEAFWMIYWQCLSYQKISDTTL